MNLHRASTHYNRREALRLRHTPLVADLRRSIHLHGRYATLRQCVRNGMPIAYCIAACAIQPLAVQPGEQNGK